RRYADYLDTDGFTVLNQISTVGSFVLGIAMLPFIWNVIKSWRYGEIVTVDDPWGAGNSLEWATSCPPPRHNFTTLPRIRSERRPPPHPDCPRPPYRARTHPRAPGPDELRRYTGTDGVQCMPGKPPGQPVSTTATPALLTVTGPDRPGVTASVMSVLATHHVD